MGISSGLGFELEVIPFQFDAIWNTRKIGIDSDDLLAGGKELIFHVKFFDLGQPAIDIDPIPYLLASTDGRKLVREGSGGEHSPFSYRFLGDPHPVGNI